MGGVTLLHPAGLLALIAAAPVIAAYLLRSRRERVQVSSLKLWRDVALESRARRPWQPPPRELSLLLELVAVVATALALARPARLSTDASPARVALVVDTSASMAALDGDATRWRLALDAARSLLRSLPPDAEVMLVSADRSPSVRSPSPPTDAPSRAPSTRSAPPPPRGTSPPRCASPPTGFARSPGLAVSWWSPTDRSPGAASPRTTRSPSSSRGLATASATWPWCASTCAPPTTPAVARWPGCTASPPASTSTPSRPPSPSETPRPTPSWGRPAPPYSPAPASRWPSTSP
nr:VWA domain-containing protein [Deltaproteobacteria bacterium]